MAREPHAKGLAPVKNRKGTKAERRGNLPPRWHGFSQSNKAAEMEKLHETSEVAARSARSAERMMDAARFQRTQ